MFQRTLGDGSQWGVELEWAVQPSPDGLAQAFIIGRAFAGNGTEPCALVLGDNIFYGNELQTIVGRAAAREQGATVFGYWVKNPEIYGVAEIDKQGRVLSIEEKPKAPKSNFAVTGLYFYDAQVCELAASLRPSARGELEITDLNRRYLDEQQLHLETLGRGFAWLDTGNPDSLLEAATFIQTIEHRQGLMIACPEEIAYGRGWIDDAQLRVQAEALAKTAYGTYLHGLLGQREAQR
jgi:glucose-1-phosphate thymidylyltransferase